MKRCVPVFLTALAVIVIFTSACSGKKDSAPVEEEIVNDSIVRDTVLETAIDTMEQIISETPMPKSADELFDDFIFNFSANKSLQLKRIVFPLVVYNEDVPSDTINTDEWQMERFFMHQGFYSLLFDNEKQMDIVKDTDVENVIVEKINLPKDSVKQYIFERKNGIWMMNNIKYIFLENCPNASFLKFYGRFVTDMNFQKASLSNPIVFIGPDPEDDFGETVTTTFAPEHWQDYAPDELPSETIYNIIYGQSYGKGNEKIFVIKGISNGFETRLDFKRIGEHWKLTQLSI